jgi:uncharacterized Zn finger protein
MTSIKKTQISKPQNNIENDDITLKSILKKRKTIDEEIIELFKNSSDDEEIKTIIERNVQKKPKIVLQENDSTEDEVFNVHTPLENLYDIFFSVDDPLKVEVGCIKQNGIKLETNQVNYKKIENKEGNKIRFIVLRNPRFDLFESFFQSTLQQLNVNENLDLIDVMDEIFEDTPYEKTVYRSSF